MDTELPVRKRLFYCLPLRYGLISWGYFKLITSSVLSIFLFFTLHGIIQMLIMFKNPYLIQNIVAVSIILVVLLTDVALNTVFLVGRHKKHLKLLRVYYVYNIVLWALTILLELVMVFLVVNMATPAGIASYQGYHTWLLQLFFSSFANLIIQSYFLLVLWSEIIRQSNNRKFRFVNKQNGP